MMSLNVRFLMALFLALTLTILPLPAELTDYRPFWVLMFVLYIQFPCLDQVTKSLGHSALIH